mgnify:CR=1 FL=1
MTLGEIIKEYRVKLQADTNLLHRLFMCMWSGDTPQRSAVIPLCRGATTEDICPR